MLRRDLATKFASDIKGATLIYVSLLMALMIGIAGLSVDISRFFIAQTQAQAAADAAAIAAASQLDGRAGARARATAAAEYAMVSDTPLVKNSQQFADEGEADAANVGVTGIRFFQSIPADDDEVIPNPSATHDATTDENAEYVEVTTEVLEHKNLLLPVLGVTKTAYVRSSAVATQGSAICRTVPMAICNPAETAGSGTEFTLANWRGRQLLVKAAPSGMGGNGMNSGGNDALWAPGNFGFLQAPEGNGAKSLAGMLGSVDGASQCFSTDVTTRPGAVNSVRAALNTRFDMYDNPFFGNESDNPLYAPAVNVTKGEIRTGGNSCGNSFTAPGAPAAFGLPEDNAFTDATGSAVGGRFGNGVWDCETYWNTNHAAADRPAGCTSATNANAAGGLSRYDIYRMEIDDPTIGIPGPIGVNTGSTNNTLQENGNPTCYSGDPDDLGPGNNGPIAPGTVFDDPENDRRIVHFAVLNCVEHKVRGQITVPSELFVEAFLTEPATDLGGNDFNVYLEIVDIVEVGTQNAVLKEWVEIVR